MTEASQANETPKASDGNAKESPKSEPAKADSPKDSDKQTTREQTSPIVALRGVIKTFSRGGESIRVLDGLDLTIHQGSFEALMGPSGSGKTTLLNLIAGLDKPTEGSVRIADQELSKMGD